MSPGKSRLEHICFDLDGTLIDSFQTIYKSTLKALADLKIAKLISEADLQNKIGHHFLDIFSELKIPVPDIEHFIGIYKEHYFDFISDSLLFPDVEETLISLKKKGIKISLLTTKGQDQAEKILEHFSLDKYFDLIMGRRPGIAVKPSAEPLHFICRHVKTAPGLSLIVGDTELDINCGKNAGAKTCAVTYGYREKDLLIKEKPDFMIGRISELSEIV